jgi:tetratricopeptide (TPR) repeat protein
LVRFGRNLLLLALLGYSRLGAQIHDHPAPEKLGSVSFPVSCNARTQPEFNRAVALLHSFAYSAAEDAFHKISERDPQCAMAHWGAAMTHFHQLWQPPLPPAGVPSATAEITLAQQMDANATPRERGLIDALALIYRNAAIAPYRARAAMYEQAMAGVAAANKDDVEAQVFYALALLADASPFDKSHSKQKQAAALLQPLFRTYPQHPGVPHYLIHADDNAEMAASGLTAARAYAKIAPSAPHALHMPSHIFTRLGLWDDSVASNIAARQAAHKQNDIGEELHAMDYLVYAYLQLGRDAEAARILQQLRAMPPAKIDDFKIGYAATVMPVRYAVERRQWAEAAAIVVPPASTLPQVMAFAVWARGIGLARGGHATETQPQIDFLRQIQQKLHKSGDDYWAAQVGIMLREVRAWSAQGAHKPVEAVALMRLAADEEDGIEKLPVTPGPVVPAREQLGDLLLEQGKADLAAKEFAVALHNAPGRRGALQGSERAAALSGH